MKYIDSSFVKILSLNKRKDGRATAAVTSETRSEAIPTTTTS
jgi:hypothetical protein